MKDKILLLHTLFLIPFFLTAQIPSTISYQGMLIDDTGTVLENGSYSIDVSLYDDSSAGNLVWSEVHTVDLNKGVFSIYLGSMNPLDLTFDVPYWLEVSLDGESMSPRTALSSSPYSLGGRATEVDAQSLASFENGLVIKGQDTAIYFVPTAEGLYIGPEENPNLDTKDDLDDKSSVTSHIAFFQRIVARNTTHTPIIASSTSNDAISGTSINRYGVSGISVSNIGVRGQSNSSWGVLGDSKTGVGVQGQSNMAAGVSGISDFSYGVWGNSNDNKAGVYGTSSLGYGVEGLGTVNHGVYGNSWSRDHAAVRGDHQFEGIGVYGSSTTERGVNGQSISSNGVQGSSDTGIGVAGLSDSHIGVYGKGKVAAGAFDGDVLIEENGKLKIDNVPDEDSDKFLVWGADKFVKKRTLSDLLAPIVFIDLQGGDDILVEIGGPTTFKEMTCFNKDVIFKGTPGVGGAKWVQNDITYAGFGRMDLDSGETIGVYGRALTDNDVAGAFDGDVDIRGQLCVDDIKVDDLCVNNSVLVKDANGDVILDIDPNADPISDYAIIFNGNLMINGGIEALFKNFKIDHPLDPENKYLRHYSIESDELKNSYDGNAVLDENGEATVFLPDWFEALNEDFRYQLTCIGAFANVYIAKEVSNNQFKIAGGSEGMKISWQVTGVRHDKQAIDNLKDIEGNK